MTSTKGSLFDQFAIHFNIILTLSWPIVPLRSCPKLYRAIITWSKWRTQLWKKISLGYIYSLK